MIETSERIPASYITIRQLMKLEYYLNKSSPLYMIGRADTLSAGQELVLFVKGNNLLVCLGGGVDRSIRAIP